MKEASKHIGNIAGTKKTADKLAANAAEAYARFRLFYEVVECDKNEAEIKLNFMWSYGKNMIKRTDQAKTFYFKTVKESENK